jgi:pimeloyl-ACP methyl ester carboxylesterase
MTASTADEGPPESRRRPGGMFTSSGRHVLVPGCGHWIPLDAPQA